MVVLNKHLFSRKNEGNKNKTRVFRFNNEYLIAKWERLYPILFMYLFLLKKIFSHLQKFKNSKFKLVWLNHKKYKHAFFLHSWHYFKLKEMKRKQSSCSQFYIAWKWLIFTWLSANNPSYQYQFENMLLINFLRNLYKCSHLSIICEEIPVKFIKIIL